MLREASSKVHKRCSHNVNEGKDPSFKWERVTTLTWVVTNFWGGEQNVVIRMKKIKCFQMETNHN